MTAGRWPLWVALAVCCIGAGCASWSMGPALPTRNSMTLDQLVVFSDSPLPQQHRLLEELRAQRLLLATKLALPTSDEPIHVYLFPTPDKLERFIRAHYPSMPHRRAFFVESDTRLTVYAYWGDRVAEDLRHEVAHGYLHAVVRRLPLWLDEGLAEYFEVPRGEGGLSRPHVAQLGSQLRDDWRPDLAQLERLRATGEMTQADYAESWAWVHFMLETTPERLALLRTYLQGLQKTAQREGLSEVLRRIEPDHERKFVDYLTVLDQSLR